jgi:hypothetical protein
MAGFKKFPHDWRKRVFRELKGIRLSVWMYHWSRSGPDDCAKVTVGQLVQDLPYSKNRIKEARSWLYQNGWLECVEATRRDGKGMWSVPVYKPIIPEVSAQPNPLSVPRDEAPISSPVPGTETGLGTRPRNAATAKGGLTVDTKISVHTAGSDAARLPVDTREVDCQSASQPSACGADPGRQVIHTVDQIDAACKFSEQLCKILNLEWDTRYAQEFLPLVVKYSVEDIYRVLNSPVLKKPFWMRDLSSVKQFIWRFESEGEDSLRAQVRQEENIARELRRTELGRKVRNRQRLTPSEDTFRLADLYYSYGWHDSSVFPDEALFAPLYEELKHTASDVAKKIDEAVSWGLNNGYEDWLRENLFPTPQLFVRNFSTFQEMTAGHDEDEEVIFRQGEEVDEL